MTTQHNNLKITWYRTGEIVDQVSVYDYEELLEGVDQHGNNHEGSALISCDKIIEIYY